MTLKKKTISKDIVICDNSGTEIKRKHGRTQMDWLSVEALTIFRRDDKRPYKGVKKVHIRKTKDGRLDFKTIDDFAEWLEEQLDEN